jgi:hypothetical protein
MNQPSQRKEIDERGLLNLYIELTGASEAEARAVVMRTCWRTEVILDGSAPSDTQEQGSPETDGSTLA